MTKQLGCILRAALLVMAAVAAATAALSAAGPPRCQVGVEEDAGCARGFETRERAGRPFRWTDGDAAVRLAGAGYGGPLVAEVTLAAPRTPGAPPAQVTLEAGPVAAALAPDARARRYLLLLPGGPPAGDVTTVRVRSDTWRPPGDRRSLGVAVYGARLLAPGRPRLPGPLQILSLAASAAAAATLAARHPRLPAPASGRLTLSRGSLAAILTLAALAGLWALLPGRSVPYLPALAAVLTLAALWWRRAAPSTAPMARPAALTLAAAVLAGAALDAALVGGALRGAWVPLARAAQGALAVWAVWRATAIPGPAHPAPDAGPGRLGTLMAVALAVRLLGLGARVLTGNPAGDPDTELFYSYGRAAIELGVPLVEYPSGALVPWAAMALPGSRELFALLLLLLNAACDLAIVWGLWRISAWGAPDTPPASAGALPLFYALSPLLLPFYGKYDPLPAALTVLGLAAFAAARPGLAGAALGLGGAVKWAPWLAAPLLGLALLRDGRGAGQARPAADQGAPAGRQTPAAGRWPLARFAAGAALAVAAVSLPFALRDLGGFLAPYTLQGARPIIGESVWLFPALLLDPGLAGRLGSPWSALDSGALPPALTVGAQLAALVALALPALLRAPSRRRALALAALAPAAFLLLNRVFSPQYALVISACALAAGGAVLRGREPLALAAALAAMQAANLLVWPDTVRAWPLASAAMFAAGGGALVWLGVRAARNSADAPRRDDVR